MPKLNTGRTKAMIRIDSNLEKKARDIAQEEHGSREKLSAVIEDSLTHYIATRENESTLEVVLSATEGALYQNIAQKFDKDFNSLVTRIGHLIAKSSYEATLNCLLMEDVFYKQRGTKERYEHLRKKASSRLKDRLIDATGSPDLAELHEEHELLKEKFAKAQEFLGDYKNMKEQLKAEQEKVKAEQAKVKEQEEKNLELQRYYQDMIRYIANHEDKGFTGKITLPKGVIDLAKEYAQRGGE